VQLAQRTVHPCFSFQGEKKDAQHERTWETRKTLLTFIDPTLVFARAQLVYRGRNNDSQRLSLSLIVSRSMPGVLAGGLALAVGLGERGIQAHVFESAPALRTDSGTIVGTNNNGEAAR